MKKSALFFLFINLFYVTHVYSSSNASNSITWVKSKSLGGPLYAGRQRQPDGTVQKFTASSQAEKESGGRRRALLESEDTPNNLPFRQLAIVIPRRKKSLLITSKPVVSFSGEEKGHEEDDTETL